MNRIDPVLIVEELRRLAPTATNGQVARSVATIWAESGAPSSWPDADARNAEGNTPAGSIDRGLCMWNSHWHAEISDECAYNWRCALKEFVRVANGDLTSLSQWVAFTNGSWRRYEIAAWLAIRVADRRLAVAELDAIIVARTGEMDALRTQLQAAIDRETDLRGAVYLAEKKIAAAKAALA